MLSRLILFCLLGLLISPLAIASGTSVDRQSADADPQTQKQSERAKTMHERRRAELENKLRVEQVVLKGRAEKGIEIEVSYRIVDADGYAAHPKTTFVADEASGKMVVLTRLARLFDPLPAAEAEKRPPASLTLWDKEGVIRPGQPVTVVVAGYGQKHLIPVAGPDYDPEAVMSLSAPKRNPMAAPDAEVTVYEARVVAQGHLLKITYTSKGIKELDTAEDQTYVENPETGEHHPIAKVPRIGALAPKNIEGVAATYMVVDNAGGRIKPGQKVNVVVSGVRAENIPVIGE